MPATPKPLQVVPSEPAPFVIVKDVPMPLRNGSTSKIIDAVKALAAAAIGASVFIPASAPSNIQQAAYRLGGPGWTSLRKCDGGFRVWKVAEPKLRA